MLIVISPAKTLDFEKAITVNQESFPEFQNQAFDLVKVLKKFKPIDLMNLMSISPKLAELNALRFKQWRKDAPKELSKQAICAFKGDVYTGLNVDDFSDADFSFTQDHLRILSGLYGVLRPLDYILPYRLEMGTKLPTKKGKNLYDFWDNKITKCIELQLQSSGNTLINLASEEYFKALQANLLNCNIITPVFKDYKHGNYKIISLFAKKARGMMSRYIIKNKLTNTEDIKHFTDGGYAYNDRLSKGNEWVFTRN